MMSKNTNSHASASNRGRPPKFTEARRPITLTLPERILDLLAAINQDRARAIVKAVEAATGALMNENHGRVEVTEISPGVGLIIVGPSRYLRQVPGLQLVEIAPARFLLAIPSGSVLETLDIALGDIMEDISAADAHERAMLEKLRAIIRSVRRHKIFSKAEILFVDTRHGAARELAGKKKP